jgi:hypothetical protein
MKMGKQIICDVKFGADGSVDEQGTRDSFNSLLARLVAQVKEDHDSVAVEVIAFLLENPNLKTISSPSLVRALWERKVEAGLLKGKTQEEKSAMYARLEEVVPEYVKANPDMFHMGRKTGIAIRAVPGEYQKNQDGSTKYDGNGAEIPAFRHTDEEWAKLTAKKAAADTAAAAQ